MRAKLDIDDDVLLAAAAIALRRGLSVGGVISELARRSLPSARTARNSSAGTPRHSGLARLGIRPLPKRGGVVTNEAINRLRNGSDY